MLHPLSKIKITKYFNYKPRFNRIYLRDNLLGAYAINLIDKKVKESIEFHYSLREIQPCTLVVLELKY